MYEINLWNKYGCHWVCVVNNEKDKTSKFLVVSFHDLQNIETETH